MASFEKQTNRTREGLANTSRSKEFLELELHFGALRAARRTAHFGTTSGRRLTRTQATCGAGQRTVALGKIRHRLLFRDVVGLH